ncbi:ATP synthase F1 subunit epsilon, partial [Salmonella enterica subsp. enterica serovar London]|nr:ATP synthase F1 subunit epsilon [Salmonella enterica subsp. enterica serovar London]
MAEPMTLQIITPDAIVFEGQSTFFVGKAIDGAFGILPNHAPMIIALDLAPLRIDQPDGTSREYAVFGGFCEIEHNKVSIVTPDCQDPTSIDVERARRAKERAEGRLSNPTPDIDVERAEAA